jgi:hypothetical protein
MEAAFAIFAVILDWMRGLDWKFLIFVVASIWFFSYWRKLPEQHEKDLRNQYKQNDQSPPPETDQLKWHVQHIREDLSLLCKLVGFLIMLQYCLIAVEYLRK